MLLFIGMITGGIPRILINTKIKKNNIILIIIISILLYGIINVLKLENVHPHVIENTPQEIIKLIGIGIIDSLASIVPGISGTAILMFLGYYNIIIDTFSKITQIQTIKTTLFVLIPFLLGFIIGTIYISKIINRIIKKYKNTINVITIVFMNITIMLLIKTTLTTNHTLYETIIGLFLFITGLIITLLISKREQ